jgi:hypothetical protein
MMGQGVASVQRYGYQGPAGREAVSKPLQSLDRYLRSQTFRVSPQQPPPPDLMRLVLFRKEGNLHH